MGHHEDINKLLQTTTGNKRALKDPFSPVSVFFGSGFNRRLEKLTNIKQCFLSGSSRRLSAAAEARPLSLGGPQTSPTLRFYLGEMFSIITGGRTNSPTAAGENLEPSIVFAAYTLRQYNDPLEVGCSQYGCVSEICIDIGARRKY